MAFEKSGARIIVALLAIPFVLAACYFGGLIFLAFTLGIGLIAFNEFAGLAGEKDFYPNKLIGYTGISLIILNAYFGLMDSANLILLIVISTLIFELFRNNKSALANSGATLLAVFYPGLFSSYILRLREFYTQTNQPYNDGAFIIIAILAGLWLCDSAAYFVGSAIGKHKLFPRVSPKKSWEGAIGGFIFAIAGVALIKYFFMDFLDWQHAIVIGIIIGTIGQTGDLVESLFKRDAGVKDSSSLIPGHGGILDRFDSLLLVAPVVFLYMHYFVKG